MCKLPVSRILWKSLDSRDWLMISFFTGAALNRQGFYMFIVLVSTFQSHNLSVVGFSPKRVSKGESTGQEVHLSQTFLIFSNQDAPNSLLP